MEQEIGQTSSIIDQKKDCLLCGAPLQYQSIGTLQTCAVCGRPKLSNVACANGHFVCDRCHSAGVLTLIPALAPRTEQDPVALFQQLVQETAVHLHGPEHHSLVPAALLIAYHNCGGQLKLAQALAEATRRGQQIPGGACGYLGVCGAAIGAGIFASIVTDSNPLYAVAWPVPQRLTACCLQEIADLGGPRCCKRTSYIAIQTAAVFSGEYWGISIPIAPFQCQHSHLNQECRGPHCPYFPQTPAE